MSRHTEAEQAVIWHDVECGGYEADLSLWRSLAAERPGPVLELGCGTGRVALDLARRGTPVVALDNDQLLIDGLRDRARELPLEAVTGDLVDFALTGRFSLILAPMQVVQLLAGHSDRIACFRQVREHLQPGGTFATAVVEGSPRAAQAPDHGPVEALPDIAERDRWVYSSLPLGIAVEDGAMFVQRLRQVVSPEGGLSETTSTDRLAVVDAALIETEAREAGLEPLRRLEVAATESHIASLVVLVEAPR